MAEKKDATEKDRFPVRFSVVFTVIFTFLYWPGMLLLPIDGIFTHLEDLFYDKMFLIRHAALKDGDPRIVIAAMDEDTGKKYGFPLPRQHQAQIIDKARAYGVKTLAFDVMFFEPQPVDSQLIAATKRFGPVVHLFQSRTENTPHGEVVSINLPIKGMTEASQYLGYPNIDLVIDNDGHVRRSMMFDSRINDPKHADHIAPSMDIVSLASFLDRPLSEFWPKYAEPAPATMLINFRRPQTWLQHKKRDEPHAKEVANLPKIESPYQMLSVIDLLTGDLTPDQKATLKGSLMLVGSTTLGYFDHYPTPFNPTAPGVEYHANNIDNLIHEDFLTDWKRSVMLPVILVMIWLPVVLLRFPTAVANGVAGGALVGWLILAWVQFGRGVRIEVVSPLVALLISFLAQTVHRALTEGRDKKFIKNLFGQFVAPEVVEDLAADPKKVKLGGDKRDMTIFFLDIAHFTSISEKLTPEDLILFLNKYLSALSNIVQSQQGVVDKYIGDCIMAFWNAPLPLADHRARACLAAIECQDRMSELNKDLPPGMSETPAIRIGLNSGNAVVGLTGSEKKLQYTVIGDEVNLASRLEGANKFFGSHIMASEATFNGAKDAVEGRELGRVRVVGKEIPIRVYELLAKKGQMSAEWRQALPFYEKGVQHFNKKEFGPAVAAFQEVLKVFPDDGPAKLYHNVSTDYGVIPPPEEWDGVFNLTAK